MNQDFKQCLENKKIIPFERGKELVKKELSISESDLLDAKAGFQEKRYKWSTIQAYYAMFHATRALVYSKGYRERRAITVSPLLYEHYLLKKANWMLRLDEIF